MSGRYWKWFGSRHFFDHYSIFPCYNYISSQTLCLCFNAFINCLLYGSITELSLPCYQRTASDIWNSFIKYMACKYPAPLKGFILHFSFILLSYLLLVEKCPQVLKDLTVYMCPCMRWLKSKIYSYTYTHTQTDRHTYAYEMKTNITYILMPTIACVRIHLFIGRYLATYINKSL